MFNGSTTAPLAFNATAAGVQSALNALPTIGGVGGSAAVIQAANVYTVTFGGEYLVGLGNYLDAGLGLGFAHSSVPSVYRSQINSDGSEIEQTLKLRVIPFTATIRFLPLGHHSSVEPYIGAGVGVLNWRYTESGEWVDPSDDSIFRQTYEGSGSEVGPLILGGIRVPLDKVALGFELRHQSAEGKLPTDQGFATSTPNAVPTIDLGGFSYLFSVNFRF